jgi:hypothetical protein
MASAEALVVRVTPARRNGASGVIGALPNVELDGHGLMVPIQSDPFRTVCRTGDPTDAFEPQMVPGLRVFARVAITSRAMPLPFPQHRAGFIAASSDLHRPAGCAVHKSGKDS